MSNDRTYPEELWWHHHPVFQLDDFGNSSPRSGQEQEFDRVWMLTERAAWTYELVRRLETMFQNNWTCNRPIPQKDRLRMFAELPSFDTLSSTWQACIARTVLAAINFRFTSLPDQPVSRVSGERGAGFVSPVEGYSPPLNTSFDLTANDDTLKKRFLEIIDELRADFRIEKRPRNKAKPHLKVKWRSLDYAHDPVAFECPQQNAARCRSDLMETAIINLDVLGLAVVGALCVEQRNGGRTQAIEATHAARRPWYQSLGDFPIADWFLRHNAAVARIEG